MSIVEKIQNLPENTVTQVPRKNNLENIYTTYSFHSNVNY